MTRTREETNRDRWHDLVAKRDAIRAKSGPLRDKRDTHVQKAAKIEAEMNAEIKKVEAPLFDLEMEIGELTRALKGKTGRLPAAKK